MTAGAGDSHLRLGAGREFDSIRELLARWGDTAIGIGDDAATVDLPRGERLVVSVDACVEGRHFQRDWITPREIGYRAVAAALSDLAAMAARPLAVLLAINAPDDWQDHVSEIGDGAADAVRAVGAVIVGGNMASASELSIATTVLGSAFEPLRRAGAEVGDRLYLTGRIGGPRAALSAWRRGETPDPASRERFVHPVPRIREARWLADRGATACIDISDGVVADAAHMAAASGRQLRIHLDRLPVIGGVAPADAARGGEEYELLVSAPEIDMAEFAAAFDLPLTHIGEVIDGDPGVTTLEQGTRVAAVPGHDHFSS